MARGSVYMPIPRGHACRVGDGRNDAEEFLTGIDNTFRILAGQGASAEGRAGERAEKRIAWILFTLVEQLVDIHLERIPFSGVSTFTVREFREAAFRYAKQGTPQTKRAMAQNFHPSGKGCASSRASLKTFLLAKPWKRLCGLLDVLQKLSGTRFGPGEWVQGSA